MQAPPIPLLTLCPLGQFLVSHHHRVMMLVWFLSSQKKSSLLRVLGPDMICARFLFETVKIEILLPSIVREWRDILSSSSTSRLGPGLSDKSRSIPYPGDERGMGARLESSCVYLMTRYRSLSAEKRVNSTFKDRVQRCRTRLEDTSSERTHPMHCNAGTNSPSRLIPCDPVGRLDQEVCS